MDSQPPVKPWERRIPGTMGAPVNYRSTDFAPPVGPSTSAGPPILTRMVPPVPPRQVQPSYRPSYGSFPSTYSPYGSSIYGGYGGYGGGYSPYSFGSGGGGGGYGMGRYNRPSHGEDVAPSRFVQQAEESSRGAFESIESIVNTFASVSMMMDATFSAVYNSFRAVLDVANQFTRLRAHLSHVLSAFALVRMLRYLYRRLQRLLGRGSEIEDLWADSNQDALMRSSEGNGGAGSSDPGVKSWPILLFFTVVLGGPYLIWKLLSSSQVVEQNDCDWASGEDDHVVARAEYDFTAASEEEISLRAGDMLNLAPKEQQPRVRGWLLASLNGQTTGLVPANYVKVLGKRRGRKHAEAEMLTQEHQANTEVSQNASAELPPSVSASGFTPSLSLSSTDELLESTYRETSESAGKSSSSTVLNIPDKMDL